MLSSLVNCVHSFGSNVLYYSRQYWIDVGDPRTRHYPLVSNGGPEVLIAILVSYLLFVKSIGPALMKNRAAFVLRGPMLLYNSFMVVVNIYFFYEMVRRCDYGRRFLNFKFPERDYSKEVLEEIRVGYWCYVTRFLDLLDTIFFVLRKKYSQITFLHVYHHFLVPIMGWMCLKIAPQAPVIGLFLIFNTLIHSVMYLYYALAAFGPGVRKYLWWKKYITQLQLLQFATCFCYGVIMAFLQTGFPPGLFWFGFAQNPIFFYQFYQFYRKAYYPSDKTKTN